MLNGRTVAVILVIGTCVIGGTFAQVPAPGNAAAPQEPNSAAPQQVTPAVPPQANAPAPQQTTDAPPQALDEDWNDFLHYTMIGRLDLARGYAQAILQGNPDPVALFELVQQNPQGYDFAMKIAETARDEELAKVTQQLLAVIDQGPLCPTDGPEDHRRGDSPARQYAARKADCHSAAA